MNSLRILTNPDHIMHPFNLAMGTQDCSRQKRIAVVAFFSFLVLAGAFAAINLGLPVNGVSARILNFPIRYAGLALAGIVIGFYLCTAIRKDRLRVPPVLIPQPQPIRPQQPLQPPTVTHTAAPNTNPPQQPPMPQQPPKAPVARAAMPHIPNILRPTTRGEAEECLNRLVVLVQERKRNYQQVSYEEMEILTRFVTINFIQTLIDSVDAPSSSLIGSPQSIILVILDSMFPVT